MATLPVSDSFPREKAILYVEDDEDTREAVSAVLADEGYRVQTAATLEDGLRAIARDHFDLVLSDYNLPDGTGDTLLMHGRASGALAGTPALLVTAMPDARSVDGIPIVKKPLTPAQLLSIVRVAIGIRP